MLRAKKKKRKEKLQENFEWKKGQGRLQIKTKQSTAQMIRNTKKKSDSGYNGLTVLYKFSGICSAESFF
jgi:hypothetical protein